MTFVGSEYSGPCSCGKSHYMETKFCIVESGCLHNLSAYMEEYSLKGYTVSVYDENTYTATNGYHPATDAEVILPATDLHANEHGVDLLLERLPEEAEILIAVGSGTIHDITRYCAYVKKIPFVSCPTAASVDGFCSSVAAMTWNGCKKTLTAVAPTIVIADLDIIKNAPLRLAKSGFGDMIGKYIALTDWKVGKILKNEYFCDRIAGLTLKATEDTLASLNGILNDDAKAYEALTSGLLLSGLAMQMIGNSRPASGAEHHISHLIEMEPAMLGVSSSALHGEKVGVGTLLVMEKYQSLLEKDTFEYCDFSTFSSEEIFNVFGEEKTNEIKKENETDCANGLLAKDMEEKLPEILSILSELPSVSELKAAFKNGEIIATLSDLGVSKDKKNELLKYAPMVRNRLTLLRLLSKKTVS